MALSIDQMQTNRMIVLITDDLATNSKLAFHIHWTAFHENLTVLYLVLVNDSENMLTVSRDMATMKALTSSNKLVVEVKQTGTSDWFETLIGDIHPGDIIICQEEQLVINGLFKTVPISDFLSSHLSSPVRTISGFYHPPQSSTRWWINELFALVGFLAILILFTWLQVRFDQAFNDPLTTVFVITTLCIEVGSIWAWNKFTYR